MTVQDVDSEITPSLARHLENYIIYWGEATISLAELPGNWEIVWTRA
ncbi:MAG: hypothetical protein FWC73_09930 [Defluviitaleaceae bacterium]|nr:hypothetical protein [Defluviitaleaceae bacterium]